MRLLLLFIFLSLSATMLAQQPNDFMLLKKRGKTVRSYFPGSHVNFVTVNGGVFPVVIDSIRKDSLWVTEHIVAMLPTRLGVSILDTIARYRYRFHYSEIRTIYNDRRGFSFSGSGASLMGGGMLLLLGSGISYLSNPKGASLGLAAAAAGLGVLGYFLTKAQTRQYKIGKRYRLQYMSTIN
jgi:hypothetical protein